MKKTTRLFVEICVAGSFVMVMPSCGTHRSSLPAIADDSELVADTLRPDSDLTMQTGRVVTSFEKTISIDGKFADWTALPGDIPMIQANQPGRSDTDVRAIREIAGPPGLAVAHDDDWVYFRFSLKRAANLQGLDHTLSLEFDVDGDALTGVVRASADGETAGMVGVDYVLEFSPKNSKSGQPGGVAAYVLERGVGPTNVNPYRIEASFAPTYAADEVEMRLRRHVELTGTNIETFANSAFSMRVVESGADGFVGLSSDPVRVEFANRDLGTHDLQVSIDSPAGQVARSRIVGSIRRATGSVRVMSWNVERGHMFEDAASFARVIRAVNPHVICFQEVGDGNGARDIQHWLETNVSAPEGWDVYMKPTTGTAVATRLASVRTGPVLMPAIEGSNHPVRASMTLVGYGGKRIVVTSVHLKCCGRTGDRNDQKRIAETKLIRETIAESVQRDHAAGILVMGDFNLVGSRTPLDNLLTGSDLDGSDLLDVEPFRLHSRTSTTWREPGQPFLPGRLDFGLVSDSTIGVMNSFVFDSSRLTKEEMNAYGVQRDDTANASDHLPIVVDLKW